VALAGRRRAGRLTIGAVTVLSVLAVGSVPASAQSSRYTGRSPVTTPGVGGTAMPPGLGAHWKDSLVGSRTFGGAQPTTPGLTTAPAYTRYGGYSGTQGEGQGSGSLWRKPYEPATPAAPEAAAEAPAAEIKAAPTIPQVKTRETRRRRR